MIYVCLICFSLIVLRPVRLLIFQIELNQILHVEVIQNRHYNMYSVLSLLQTELFNFIINIRAI